MTHQRKSIELATESAARGRNLEQAVQHAVRTPQVWTRAGIVAAGLTVTIPSAMAAPFPPVFPLAGLLPGGGGDGTQGFVLTGTDEHDYAGRSVSGAGDVNGDGTDDVIVGAPGTRPPDARYAYGASFVVFGSTQGFAPVLKLATLFPAGGGDGSQGFVIAGPNNRFDTGVSVSRAGDVNGDGIDDVIVGDQSADPGGHANAGESYVIFGSMQGFPAMLPVGTLFPAGGGDGSAGFVIAGLAHEYSGKYVSAAGDLNGDGVDDLIVAGGGNIDDAGNAYVVFGSTQGFSPFLPLSSLYPANGGDGSAGFVIAHSALTDDRIKAVSAAGDVNGDGVDDIIVGTPWADSGGQQLAGVSYVVFGSTQGFPAVLPLASLYPAGGGDGSAGFVLSGFRFNGKSGSSVSTAGDVNGDGVDDLLVGAPYAHAGGNSYSGEAYVVFGSTQGFPPVLPLGRLLPGAGGDGSAGFVLSGVQAEDQAGNLVSAAGDVNADGIDDIIVGAHVADAGGQTNAGESYVVFGLTQGFPAVLPLADRLPANGGDGSTGVVFPGIDEFDFAAESATAAGDVNGDGIGDLIIGARGADQGRRSSAGESYVVFGRASETR